MRQRVQNLSVFARFGFLRVIEYLTFNPSLSFIYDFCAWTWNGFTAEKQKKRSNYFNLTSGETLDMRDISWKTPLYK